jgi:hypothetical protein
VYTYGYGQPYKYALLLPLLSIDESKVLFIYFQEWFTRVGQNRIHTPYITVYLVVFLPKIPYIHHIYIYGSGQPYSYRKMGPLVAVTCTGCKYPAKNALWSYRWCRSPIINAPCVHRWQLLAPTVCVLLRMRCGHIVGAGPSGYPHTLRTPVAAACTGCMCPAKNALWSYRWCRFSIIRTPCVHWWQLPALAVFILLRMHCGHIVGAGPSGYPHTLRTPVAAACTGCMYPATNALWSYRWCRSPVIRTPYVHRWQLPAVAVCVLLRMHRGHIVGAGLRLSAHPTYTGGSCLLWLYVSC